MKAVHPQGLVRYSLRQFRHSVGAVPFRKVCRIVEERVEVLDFLREEEARNVLVPTVDTLASGVDAEGIECPLVYHLKRGSVFGSIFRLFGQHVESEVVFAGQVRFQSL